MVGANSCDDGSIVCNADENCYDSGCCPKNRNICTLNYTEVKDTCCPENYECCEYLCCVKLNYSLVAIPAVISLIGIIFAIKVAYFK